MEGENENTEETVVETSETAADPIEAFRQGVEEVTETPKEADGPSGAGVEGADNSGATEVPGATGAAAAAEPVKPEVLAETERKAAVDKEIKDLGIKNKAAAERFRNLSEDSRKYKELAKTLPELQEKAAKQDRMIEILNDTGATDAQLGTSFKYLKAINSNDPAQLKEAFEFMSKEAASLGKALGLEVGAVDPLESHADLLKAVEDGDMTRKYALEIAANRGAGKINDTRTAAQKAEADRNMELKTASDNALAQLGEFERQTKAIDPDWNYKLNAMGPTIEIMKANVHPSKWAAEFKRAYALIPAPPKVVKPAANPVRPNGAGGGSTMAHIPKDATEAFRFGVKEAS